MRRLQTRWTIHLASVLFAILLHPPWLPSGGGQGEPVPGVQESGGGPDAVFRTQVELVVLHATVYDRKQQLVTGLPREAFEVLLDGKRQSLAQFSNQDIPVSMGILVDSSASIGDKRASVNAAALALVRASNPQDEVFVVNFRDLPELAQDFTSDIGALEQGLSEVRMWGGTAVLDTIHMALTHLQDARRDKKVLLVVTDGEDDASKTRLEELRDRLQQEEVTVYTIGIPSAESSRSRRNAERMLKEMAKVSGGASYFPRSLEEVGAVATRIAHDIRNQYVLAFPVPSRSRPGFHAIEVKARASQRGKLTVRTRSGYFYAPSSE